MDTEILISNTILVETSLNVLYNNTVNGFDSDRASAANRVQVLNKDFVASPDQGVLLCKARTRSSAKQYETRIAFSGIEYQGDEEQGGQTTTFQTPDGQEYTIVPAQYANTDVQVSCSCLDFYYLFAAWNSKDGSLQGNPPPAYVPKTDREPRNPQQLPGMCKHLIALSDDLRQQRIVV